MLPLLAAAFAAPLATLLASAATLSAAEGQLALREPAQVLRLLDAPDAIDPDERVAAGRLLCSAAELARELRELPLALLLAQRAAQVDALETRPLQLLAQWSLNEQEFAAARRYGQAWRERAQGRGEPEPEADRFLQRLALLEQSRPPPDPQKKRPGKPRKGERKPKAGGAGEAAPPAPGLPAAPPVVSAAAEQAIPLRKPILFGGANDPRTTRARDWLRKQGLDFEERDIEQDKQAALELSTRIRAVGGGIRGMPVLDLSGRLLGGFDEKEWRAELGLPVKR